jgi:imidazolonepropionase
MKTLFYNIGMLATAQGSRPLCGREQGEVKISKDAWILSRDGIVVELGEGTPPLAENKVDCKGLLVTPGLVDCHTHLVFGGWRENELEMKLEGKNYLDILKAGGGILSTVKATRQIPEEDLLQKSQKLLKEAMLHGTTAIEIKSGYGLDRETEEKQLRVAKKLRETNPDIALTYMGAHAFPKGMTREEYIDLICEEGIPSVAKQGLAEFCDVFCDEGVFSAEESERILAIGKEHGLIPKMHADEIREIGGVQVAAKLGAISCDHVSETGDEGMEAFLASGMVAVMLPATSFYLQKPYGKFRTMIDKGIPVAIASDFNPGSSPGLSMPFAMTTACLYNRLTPKEALVAATLNSACAIGMGKRLGTLEKGKSADLVVWDTPNLNRLVYRFGSNLALAVYKRGQKV